MEAKLPSFMVGEVSMNEAFRDIEPLARLAGMRSHGQCCLDRGRFQRPAEPTVRNSLTVAARHPLPYSQIRERLHTSAAKRGKSTPLKMLKMKGDPDKYMKTKDRV